MTAGAMRYTRVAMGLHWIIAALIVANLAIGLLHDSSPEFRAAMPAHKSIGLTVIGLTLVRIGWRIGNPPPPLPVGVEHWQRRIAAVTHAALYALMLAMPISGWLMVSGAHRRALGWFGLFPVPYLPVGPAAAKAGDVAHLWLGWLTLVLVFFHAGAAVYHWLALGDGVMARIAPVLERHPEVSPGRPG